MPPPPSPPGGSAGGQPAGPGWQPGWGPEGTPGTPPGGPTGSAAWPPPPPLPGGAYGTFGTWDRPSQWQRGRPIQLRDMKVGETLDAAINIYRLHWKTFAAIVAVAVVPFQFIRTISIRAAIHPFTFGGRRFITRHDADSLAVVSLVFLVLYVVFLSPLLTGAMVRTVGGVYRGETPSLGESYGYALARLGSILLVVVLATLAVAGGLLLFVVPGIIFYVRFIFGSSVVVMEGRRGRRALSRAWHLSEGMGWRILGTILLGMILAGVVNAILIVPAQLLAPLASTYGWFIQAVAQSLASIITAPFITMLPVLMYFSARVRKEGLDLVVMAQEITPGSP
jgi:hypothetical protein